MRLNFIPPGGCGNLREVVLAAHNCGQNAEGDTFSNAYGVCVPDLGVGLPRIAFGPNRATKKLGDHLGGRGTYKSPRRYKKCDSDGEGAGITVKTKYVNELNHSNFPVELLWDLCMLQGRMCDRIMG